MSRAGLESAARYSDSRGGFSLLVLRRGRTVYEHYAPGYGPLDAHPLYSGTKSFWGVTAAAAVGDGLLSNLDERVSDTLPEWRGVPGKESVTVRQLLGLQAGLPFAKGAVDGPAVTDQYQASIAVALERSPGTAFGYGPAGFSVFGEVLERKLASRDDALTYLRARLLKPAGVAVGSWTRDGAGHPTMGSGASLTARAWARWGAFVLDGARRRVDTTTFDAQFRTGIIPGYGLSWWLNKPTTLGTPRAGNVKLIADASGFETASGRTGLDLDGPRDLVVGAGNQGQRLYLQRSTGIVVVRQGRGNAFADRELLGRLGLGGPS